MNVRLHIDRLVLDGFSVSAANRPRLQAAIEQELTRLITANGISPALASGGALPSIDAPQITLTPHANPTQLGTSIAGALYGGVGGAR